ncbi:MAG TPA: chaplin [Yinghuangia sp.]|uniref:chaplin n=1 Tax=Yinghuangia sp. YIM S10712 TaxID=3436930 RepID=UPI002BA3E1F0|nr:chaplin [Yinghuangia sp.]
MTSWVKKSAVIVAAAGVMAGLGAGTAFADSAADGTATNSPGLISGNNIQVPIHLPINACGNTVDIIGLLNPTAGNACANA